MFLFVFDNRTPCHDHFVDSHVLIRPHQINFLFYGFSRKKLGRASEQKSISKIERG